MLLQEKDERISDLKREAETLGIFAHYFKSLEYRRLEASSEEREIRKARRKKKSQLCGRDSHTHSRKRAECRSQKGSKPAGQQGPAQGRERRP